MKIFLSVIIVFSSSILTFGQNYQSIFSSDTTKWYVYECLPDAGGTIVYYSFSDSLINNKIYNVLYKEYLYEPNQTIGDTGEICGFIYENLADGQYFFMKPNFKNKEVLFIDFSLEENDTFKIITDFRFMTTESVIVDSIYYENDLRHVVFNHSEYGCPINAKLKFIEGIGSTNGFYMSEHYEESKPYSLICKYSENKRVYHRSEKYFPNCYADGGGNVNEINFDFSIYPNPAKGCIVINNEKKYIQAEYKIINLLGQTISNGYLKSNSTTIEINEPGLFYILLFHENYQSVHEIINYGY